MKKLAFLIIALFSAAAFAQNLPRIAVYVTGDVQENEKKALGTRMLASLINSKRYKGIERSNSFLAEIEKEQEKQRSGEIDDNQISALGKQFGVKFVCIADITPAFGEFQVSARIINVETAEVEFIGDASGQLKSMADLTTVSNQVVKNMFDEQTRPAAVYALAVANPTNGGAVSVNPQKTVYNSGERVTITASPYDGYTFDSWSSGAAASTQNPITVTMNSNMKLTANFQATPKPEPASNSAAGSVPKKALSPTTQQTQDKQYTSYTTFTDMERIGTLALNWFTPGVGSVAIMQDWGGAVTQLVLVGGGVICILNGMDTYEKTYGSGYYTYTETIEEPNAFFVIGIVAMGGHIIFNISRSITYKKKMPKNTASLENTGLQWALLPDRNGEVKAYLAYRASF